MTQTLRWGVLGAARFALNQMAPAIHAARGAELLAIATSSQEKAAPFEAFAPGLKVHLDYDALLADPSVDAVYIPLPNALHVDWTLKALAAGKHVLCEKPLGLKAEDFDRVIAARDETGLMAAEAFMITHHPQWARVRQLLAEGALGELRHVEAVFCFKNDDMTNIRNRAEVGGGALPDVGVYVMGSIRFATGQEPEAITHADLDWEAGVDTYAHVAARFPGFRYSGLVSTRLDNRQGVVFHGTEGRLTMTTPFTANAAGLAEIVLDRTGQPQQRESWPGLNQYVLQVEAFCRSVREGAPYACPLEFSRGTQAMIDAVYAAAGRGNGAG
ncbi:Gfo/Idh/MocA family protein [Pseudoroseicyclus aestuarii]|uniref:Putative dehydrogenase n=1 Tax=Pseudoroseicyclus aestuarii TaxID=1795041 RepID=A0A318SWB2_9RHOB|nr:Gfo/Idh/MocA family oxidoreductase [Pseudoroseicyclus aestuarii]PYE85813.1 putative dehydrogenase [Pseudoroseicyclus aestuarii]